MTQFAKTGGRLIYLRQDSVYKGEIYKCIGCEHKLEIVYDYETGAPSHFKHPAGSRAASMLKRGELCEQMSPLGKNFTEQKLREYSGKTFANIQRQIEVGEIQAEDLLKLLREFTQSQGSLIVEYNLLKNKYEELDKALAEAHKAEQRALEAEREFNKRALEKEYPTLKPTIDKIMGNNKMPWFRAEEELEKEIFSFLFEQRSIVR